MIREATEKDYYQIANIRWEHALEDDKIYNENNTKNTNREKYIEELVEFLKQNKEYKIFVTTENKIITSTMFVYLVPKIPNPNGNSKYIAYLTKVFTKKEYRNKGIGTELLNYIKEYLKNIKCELIFAWPSDNSINWYKKNNFTNETEIMEFIIMDE